MYQHLCVKQTATPTFSTPTFSLPNISTGHIPSPRKIHQNKPAPGRDSSWTVPPKWQLSVTAACIYACRQLVLEELTQLRQASSVLGLNDSISNSPLCMYLGYSATRKYCLGLVWPYTFCLGPVLEKCNKSERWWSGVAVARWSRSTKLTYVGPG